MKRSTRGLTLLELTVTVAIIAIVSVAGALTMSSVLAGRLEAEARALVADLRWARQRAVASRADYLIVLDSAQKRYTIYLGSIDSANLVKQRSVAVEAIAVTPNAPVVFTAPRGLTNQSIQTITLTDRGRTMQVTIFGETGYVK